MNRGPNITWEVDEDGTAIPNSLSVGWDVTFGCRINFGPDSTGRLHVAVNVSDSAQRDGIAVGDATAEDLRELARRLEQVAREADAR